MLDVALAIEPQLDQYSRKYVDVLRDDHLTLSDWESLRTIHQFLQPFSHATLETQGDSATIDKVLITMDILIKHFTRVSCKGFFKLYHDTY